MFLIGLKKRFPIRKKFLHEYQVCDKQFVSILSYLPHGKVFTYQPLSFTKFNPNYKKTSKS